MRRAQIFHNPKSSIGIVKSAHAAVPQFLSRQGKRFRIMGTES
jgi:hypothetical protein